MSLDVLKRELERRQSADPEDEISAIKRHAVERRYEFSSEITYFPNWKKSYTAQYLRRPRDNVCYITRSQTYHVRSLTLRTSRSISKSRRDPSLLFSRETTVSLSGYETTGMRAGSGTNLAGDEIIMSRGRGKTIRIKAALYNGAR